MTVEKLFTDTAELAVARSIELEQSSEREQAVALIVTTNLEELRRRYGESSPTPLAYHNFDHSLDVVEAASQLADLAIAAGNIDSSEKDLLLIAASGHDLEQRLGSKKNEQASADEVCEQMARVGVFDIAEINKVRAMIMGTVVFFDDTGKFHQSPPEHDALAKLLADADLAALGKCSPFYWDRAVRLLREIKAADPTREELAQFAIDQEAFLNAHQYYTDEARELFCNKDVNSRFTGLVAQFYCS